MSMRDVEKMTDISKTKVSDILHRADSPDKQIFLCHNLRSNLYKNGTPVREYAELCRAKNIFIIRGIKPGEVLATIRKITELCFRISLEPQTLVTCFDTLSHLVYSMAHLYPEDVKIKLKSDLQNLQSVSDDLDVVMQNCKNLRIAIDIRERSARTSKNSTGKN